MRLIDTKRPERVLTAVITFMLASPHALVSWAVLFGPLSRDTVLPAWFAENPVPSVTLVFLAGYVGYRISFRVASFRKAVACLALSCAALTATSVVSGVVIHRDFFSAAFQYVMGVPAAFLFLLVSRSMVGKPPFRRETTQSFGSAGYVIAAFYGLWVMMMGYAISTRAEPRPVESMLYNVHNLCLVLAIALLSRDIRLRGCSRVECSGDGLLLDGKDVVAAFGAKKAGIFHALASADDRTLRCSEINAVLSGDGTEFAECARCDGENTKAALCKRYRTTYNVILELKKTLELLEIGSITAAENRRLILTEGWKLVLFEGVRLTVRKKKAERRVMDPPPA